MRRECLHHSLAELTLELGETFSHIARVSVDKWCLPVGWFSERSSVGDRTDSVGHELSLGPPGWTVLSIDTEQGSFAKQV